MNRKVRVRFAPSPTGPLHIGGVRTALFNYLFAKKHGGDFLLRIEDTDQKRYVAGAEDYIVKSLEWCGFEPDESVQKGGDFGPYKQSERRNIYQKYVQKLIDSGHAYYAFDTPEELDAQRKRLEASGSSVRHYNASTRGEMKNSFTLSAEEVEKRINSGEPFVVRFNMPQNETIIMHDIIRGEVRVNSSELDDKVLSKSDGLPTYHLANIVDDHLMQISHVIRGEEWLPSMALHVSLYKAFGWEDTMPEFAHLPLLLKPDGKGKLSKRDGDRLGFPVFPMEWTDPKSGEISRGYKEDGYLPKAFVNMLAFLGWNPGTEQEIFSMDELIQAFDLSKINKAGAKFSADKAKWFNQQYIKNSPDGELAGYFKEILKSHDINDVDEDYLIKVTGLVKERVSLLPDFWAQAAFFFKTPTEYNPKSVKKQWKVDTPEIVTKVKSVLEDIPEDKFTSEYTEENVKAFITENELSFGKVLNPIRLSLTGTGGGPHLFDIVAMLGKTETLKRLDKALAEIKK